jgi:hypothetical protein
MGSRRILRFLGPGVAASFAALAMTYGCSSSSSPTTPAAGSDAGGGDTTAAVDAPDDHVGEGNHDGPPPDALYGCALPGSFGAPCTAATSGADPTDCTDPEYPVCFVGGQGAWCTKSCTAGGSECTTAIEDGGCAPTSCNARGYCK